MYLCDLQLPGVTFADLSHADFVAMVQDVSERVVSAWKGAQHVNDESSLQRMRDGYNRVRLPLREISTKYVGATQTGAVARMRPAGSQQPLSESDTRAVFCALSAVIEALHEPRNKVGKASEAAAAL